MWETVDDIKELILSSLLRQGLPWLPAEMLHCVFPASWHRHLQADFLSVSTERAELRDGHCCLLFPHKFLGPNSGLMVSAALLSNIVLVGFSLFRLF